MNIPEYLIIVASSGRMLAQAAIKAGLKPLVIDLFADLDTQGYAEAFHQIPSLAEEHLAPALDDFVEYYGTSQVIYGSGLDYYPESVRYLGNRLHILGNDPDTFVKLQDKPVFFSALDKFNIPYPAVSFTAPADGNDWLIKPMQGQGGAGIQRYHQYDRALTSVYWQQYQAGTPHSVLFLADGQTVQVIGFNTQWSVNLNADEDFVFSGIINNSDLEEELKQRMLVWLEKIVPVFGLKGLNSLDFIEELGCPYILEINPRPSASMQLYDEDLLVRHIKASTGADLRLASEPQLKLPLQSNYSGYQIVYAPQDLIIPEFFDWPEGCMDLPKSGDLCRAGEPICSIIAHAKKPQHVLDQLLIKQQLIVINLIR